MIQTFEGIPYLGFCQAERIQQPALPQLLWRLRRHVPQAVQFPVVGGEDQAVADIGGGLVWRDDGGCALEGVAGEEAPEDRPVGGREAVEAVVAAA